MAVHTIKRFEEELNTLKEFVLSMGGLVERAIGDAVRSVLEHDIDLARKTIAQDSAINALEVQCDDMTQNILARRQPAAGDLRFIISMIKVVTDLERMGDLSVGICEGLLRMEETPPKHYSSIAIMGEKVQQQVNRALDALSRGDIDLAMEVIEKDKAIDDLYHGIYRETLTYMMEDPRTITTASILFDVGKGLERIGDHATNISEMVIYMIKAHDIRHIDPDAVMRLLQESKQV